MRFFTRFHAINLEIKKIKYEVRARNDDRPPAVMKAVIEGLKRKQPKGTWTRALIEKEIARWRTLKNGKYREYCQVAIYILEKRLP